MTTGAQSSREACYQPKRMGLLSILLSALAVVCAGIGVLTTPLPKVGLIFAFGAPLLAIAGVMVGGSAMSKAKRTGQPSETGKIGAILSAIAFVPSVLVALTCGVCNAFFSTSDLQVQRNFRFGRDPFVQDGGVVGLPPPQRAPSGAAGAEGPAEPGSDPSQPPGDQPQPPRTPPDAPPSSLPPPPLPPGPGK